MLERRLYRVLRLMAAVCFMVVLLASCCEHAAAESAGLWIMPRKDTRNTARADVAGRMTTAPKEIWAYGYDPEEYFYVRPITIKGKTRYLAQVQYGLQLLKPNGDKVWRQPNMGLSHVVDIYYDPGTGKPMAFLQFGNAVIKVIDLTNGEIIWKWQVTEEAYLGLPVLIERKDRVRFITVPMNSGIGFCFEITPASRTPQLLWKCDMNDRLWKNYGPTITAADMNRDGKEEIIVAGKPTYFGVIDQDTGKILFDLQYHLAGVDHMGRPYGFLGIDDIDGDGYPDLVMASKNVEEYIGVARNVRGKKLRLAWSKWISLDFPEEKIKLRPCVQSLADLRGDGKHELVLSLFNEDNDGRWKTVVFDGLKGYDKRLAELKDRYLVGCYDINGDGAQEIITSPETLPDPVKTTLIAVDGRTFKDIATLNASPDTYSARLPLNVGFGSTRETPLLIRESGKLRGLLVMQSGVKKVWRIVDGRSVVEPLGVTALAGKVLNSEGTGMVKSRKVDLPVKKSKGAVSAGAPLVSMFNGERELILAQADGTIVGGVPDLGASGKFSKSWQVQGIYPTVWIGPDGRRIVCTVDSTRTKVYLYEPKYQAGDDTPVATIVPPHPVKPEYLNRSTYGLLPFGDKEFRILVGMQVGAHAVASAVYDIDGKVIWEDKENGPYPRSAAADDLYNTGNMNVVMDNHGMELIYDETGAKKMYAFGWHLDVPGRDNGGKYTLPIIGDFGPSGKKRMVLSSGLDSSETVDAYGSRISKIDLANTYELDWSCSSVAKIRPDAWDYGMIDKFGFFTCVDLETSKSRWTLDFSFTAHLPSVISTADVDGDGRDNFILSTPTGDLMALDEKDGKGFVMWKMHFDTTVKDAYMADLDGDDIGELVVELANGFVRIFR